MRQPKDNEYENSQAGYFTWNSQDEFNQVMKATAGNFEEYGGVSRSTAGNIGRTFIGTDPNVSVRSEYNRADYDYYRQGETVPNNIEGIMRWCMSAYEKVGIIRNVIDLMSDFTVQGIRITHPKKNVSNFLKRWVEVAKFVHTSERIANMVYRVANCPVKIKMGKVPVRIVNEWKRTQGSEDVEIFKEKIEKRRIPLGYNILDPLSLKVIGGELASFIGKPIYGLKIDFKLRNMIQQMRELSKHNHTIDGLLKSLPTQLQEAIIRGEQVLLLDPDKLEMVHYKKDDWKVWAMPITYAVLDNLILLEKMHLADRSALDGAISQVRLWKLGNIEAKILPSKAVLTKLRNILANTGTAGVLDLVWGPELDFKESSTSVHNFLGPAKYQQIMAEIYAGLGIPPSLTGSSSKGTQGFTNNFISMKTLVERLEYGRKAIVDFWNKQFKILQEAMEWSEPPQVTFDYKVLSDENAERNLLIQLWDRDIISTETLQDLCNRDPDLEKIRIRREERQREKGLMPDKASPYHNPDWDLELKKLVLQGGVFTPSQVGLILEEGNPAEEEQVRKVEDFKASLEKKYAPKLPSGGNGRPKGKKDSTTRKQRKPKPKDSSAFMNMFLWANEAQKSLNDILVPGILKNYQKKNIRSLTNAQFEEFEKMKFHILTHLDSFSKIDEETVYNILVNKNLPDKDIVDIKDNLLTLFHNHYKRPPTLDEMHQMQSSAYTLKYGELDVESSD